jgi:hypothetical protein
VIWGPKKLKLPFRLEDGSQKYANFGDITNHGHRSMLLRFRGPKGMRGESIKAVGCLYRKQRLFRRTRLRITRNRGRKAYQDWAVGMGIYDAPQPTCFRFMPNRCANSSAPPKAMAPAPDHLCARVQTHIAAADLVRLTSTAMTALPSYDQRPMAMYHMGQPERGYVNARAQQCMCPLS